MQASNTNSVYDSGEYVIVRAYKGRPLMRRVLSVTESAVFVCAGDDYERIMRGEKETPMIGFPRGDVFVFQEAVFERLEAEWKKGTKTIQGEWEKLKQAYN